MKLKKLIKAFLLVFILFFVSCGMPSYHDFDGEIITTTPISRGFRVSFSDAILNQNFNSLSPSILLMYSITDDGNNNLENDFDLRIKYKNANDNGVPAIFSNGRLDNVQATVDNKNIYLYEFTSINENGDRVSLSSAPGYTYPSLDINHVYYFVIRTAPIENENTQIYLIVDIYQDNTDGSPISSIPLYRYNNSAFYSTINNSIANNNPDYMYYSDANSDTEISSYEIQVFLAVNIVPDENSSFSNIYWTELDSITLGINNL